MAIQFGVGTLQISGTGGTHGIAKLQNISINIGYESQQLRGSSDVFACDTQFYDGSIEGSFEHGDMELSNIGYMLQGSGAFAGAANSGTVTLTGGGKPKRFKLVFSGVTNGITSTIVLHRVFIPSLTLDFSRTDYMIPSMSFVCEYSTATGLMTWQM